MKDYQQGFVLWFTGLSGAGKSTLADEVYKRLIKKGYKRTQRLDGDLVRKNLTKDLGFSKKDRAENIKRVAFVSALLSGHGIGVIASFISPYQRERDLVRRKAKNFIEVYVSTPLEVCEKRDIKGLYKKARAGEIENFTGISDPYEAPKNPELEVCGDKESKIGILVDKVIAYLKQENLL
jgi:adenylyl-sulfate kinase